MALQEKIAAFDACTFKSCFCITSKYLDSFKMDNCFDALHLLIRICGFHKLFNGGS